MGDATNALVEVLNSPTRAYPLRILARVKYPDRELSPVETPDGSIAVTVLFYGWEYKHRGKRPRTPPSADTEGIKQALNTALAPRFTVRAVTGANTKVIISIRSETT